ncbi:MAG: hypothetical protein J5826_04630, partial [Bacteroidales bacterium]|nr:hypothetical protein [Bacteroidales bacterium]
NNNENNNNNNNNENNNNNNNENNNNENNNNENPNTPVSSITDAPVVKVWAYNSTIYIENAPDAKYTIIDLNGRMIKSATTKSTYEQININKEGVFVVIINRKSFKVAL